MKTTKLFLSIALLALTVVAFGKTSETEYTAIETELTMENWMSDPFNSMENDPLIETWMSSPFVSPEFEEEIFIESWMTSSFGLGTELETLALESWMTAPFEATNDNCPEALMAASSN